MFLFRKKQSELLLNHSRKMFCRQIVRQSLNKIRCYSTEKSPLALLRKKTGYSFVNCKKALELNSNDVAKVSDCDGIFTNNRSSNVPLNILG